METFVVVASFKLVLNLETFSVRIARLQNVYPTNVLLYTVVCGLI